jgi:hypothetical protein
MRKRCLNGDFGVVTESGDEMSNGRRRDGLKVTGRACCVFSSVFWRGRGAAWSELLSGERRISGHGHEMKWRTKERVPHFSHISPDLNLPEIKLVDICTAHSDMLAYVMMSLLQVGSGLGRV